MKILIFIILPLVLVGYTFADDEWLAPWQRATVMIVGGDDPDLLSIHDTLSTQQKANATGFLVQSFREDLHLPPLVLTCRHVIDSLYGRYDALHIYLYSQNDEEIYRDGFFCCSISIEHISSYFFFIDEFDLVAFILDTTDVIGSHEVLQLLDPFDFSQIRYSNNLNHGDMVAILGYPGSILRSYPWTDRPLLRIGNVSWLSADDSLASTYIVDIPTHPGYSGSPVIFIQEYSPNTLDPEPVSFAGIQTSAIAYNDSSSIIAGHSGLAIVITSDIVINLCEFAYGIILDKRSYE